MVDEKDVKKVDEFICCSKPAKYLGESILIKGSHLFKCEHCFQGHIVHEEDSH